MRNAWRAGKMTEAVLPRRIWTATLNLLRGRARPALICGGRACGADEITRALQEEFSHVSLHKRG